jgi:hypothetical protein
MVQVLSLIRPYGHARVRAAVEEAITLGCADAAAVRHLVEAVDLTHARDALSELGELSRFERPAPVMTDYVYNLRLRLTVAWWSLGFGLSCLSDRTQFHPAIID